MTVGLESAAASRNYPDARRVAERVARESYGRLIALVVSRTRDLAAAEDALADAFVAAMEHWTTVGPPANPDAWLLTAARRRLIDAHRHNDMARQAAPEIARPEAVIAMLDIDAAHIPDERLRLLFLCAHPALDASIRTPLMLQCVLGLDAGTIAGAFLLRPSTLAQRLVRAKQKVRDAGIAFEMPAPQELSVRLDAVLDAIYVAYSAGWDAPAKSDLAGSALADEAIWLGRVLWQLIPEEPEVAGLLALMLHTEARRAARRSAGGRFIPLRDQDTALWSPSLIQEAETLLATAARQQRLGRFQLEAAIQSAHAARRRTGTTDWPAIVGLYRGLLQISPSVGAQVAFAAAVGEASGPEAGFHELAAVDNAQTTTYQPYWAARAHLLQRLERFNEAEHAFDRAIGLSSDDAVRDHLMQCRGGVAPGDR